MTQRTQVTHGLPIEELFGYSTGVRVDGEIYVAGQLARDASGKQIPQTAPEAKIDRVVANITTVIDRLGGLLDDLVQVQVHVSDDVGDLDDVMRLCQERFGQYRPAGTIVPVHALNDAGGLFEISAIAAPTTSPGEANTMTVTRIETEGPERAMGFSRAVKAGSHVYVSAQMDVDTAGAVQHEGRLAEQFAAAFANVVKALEEAGATADDVVATHMFLTKYPDEAEFVAICDAHRNTFPKANKPTGTMVYVPRLPLPAAMVEVSAVAVIDR